MSKVWVIQHAPCETLGTIADALSAVDIPVETVRTFEGEPVPKTLEGFDGLILMGGPMGVYEQDRYPFLRDEIRLIQESLKNDRPILGVCLGSQLLASALGARVSPGREKEIGWHPVRLTDAAREDPLWKGVDDSFTAYHWHGDIFELPSGAVSLASSDLTRHQAFRYGRNAYGTLFHMEVTGAIIRNMVKTFGGELHEAGIDGQALLSETGKHLRRLQAIGKTVFGRWAASVAQH
jgi:GMP synthase (glutamine-hydrolysing)